MSADYYRCGHCGASLSLEQLRGTDCPFCKQVFPHHAQAAQHAAVVNQVMAQQIAQANAMWGAPPQVPHGYGQSPPPFGVPHSPYQQQAAQVERVVKTSLIMTFVIVGVTMLLVIGGVAAAIFMAH